MNLTNIGIGIGAGIATALLYAALLTSTPFAFVLFLLSPLPIAIVSLGWGWPSGAIAVVVSAVAVTFAAPLGISPLAGIVFALLFAAPAVWLSYLAGLSRPVAGAPTGTVEWFPPGRLLRHGVLAVSAALIAAGLLVRYNPTALTEAIAASLGAWTGEGLPPGGLINPDNVQSVSELVVALLPYSMSLICLAMVLISVWLGSKITASSGLLKRPSAPLSGTTLPAWFAGALGVALLLTFLPFPIAAAAGTFVGAATFAFALAGLALIHAATVGQAARILILAGVYVAIVLLSFPVLIVALIGVADSLIGLRGRFTPNRPNRPNSPNSGP